MEIQFTGIVAFIVALLLAMSFHEATHAFVAHWLGDTTAHEEGRLTLNPLKHIDLLTTILLPTVLILLQQPPILAAKPVPINTMRVRYDEFGLAMIGIAGPLSNLLLAVVTAVFVRSADIDLSSMFGGFLITFIAVNVGLFLFNMLPIPPLDGSRLLYAFAPEPLQKVMLQIEAFGLIVVIIILFALLPIIGPVLSDANGALMRLLLGSI